MTPLELLILSLCAWYVAYVLIKTSGPFNLFARLRALTTLGGLLECLWCLVVWLAMVAYVLYVHTPFREVVYVGAVAGGAMILHRYTGGDHG
jgi:hypothetical protein